MTGATTGLEQIYLAHRDELLRFLVARTGDRAEAEDVLQMLWLKLGRAASGPVANGRAYLYRMAQNLVFDRVRERQRRSARDSQWTNEHYGSAGRGEVADQRANAESLLSEQGEAARLADAIASLPPAAGRAFRLHKLDGLSHAEVAAQLGISRSGVEKHIAVAMAHLCRRLRD